MASRACRRGRCTLSVVGTGSGSSEANAYTSLQAAITALAARNSVPTSVDVGNVRLSDAAQNAAYFTVAEALTNVTRHAGATQARHQCAGRLGVREQRIGAQQQVHAGEAADQQQQPQSAGPASLACDQPQQPKPLGTFQQKGPYHQTEHQQQ